MTATGTLLCAVGIFCLLWRRALLGLLIGGQILSLGLSMLFLASGIGGSPTVAEKAQLGGLFIVLTGVGQAVAGFALAVRVFYQRKRAVASDLAELRH